METGKPKLTPVRKDILEAHAALHYQRKVSKVSTLHAVLSKELKPPKRDTVSRGVTAIRALGIELNDRKSTPHQAAMDRQVAAARQQRERGSGSK